MVDVGAYFSLGSKNANQVAEYKSGGIFSILSVILRNIYVVAGIILLIMIFASGLGMILNAGNPEKLKKSNSTLSSAVIGFIILFSSYWLIQILEIILKMTIIDL